MVDTTKTTSRLIGHMSYTQAQQCVRETILTYFVLLSQPKITLCFVKGITSATVQPVVLVVQHLFMSLDVSNWQYVQC